MRSCGRWRVAILVVAILLAAPGLARDRLRYAAVADAASLPLLLQSSQTRKGFVTAKASRSMTVLEGSSAIEVIVTEKTNVAGQRTSFANLAIDDVVRVEGSMTAAGHLLAHRVEVILAANSMIMGRRAKTRNVNNLISMVLNGGITVVLP
jgi:ribulose kinase